MRKIILIILAFLSSLSYSQELMTVGEVFDFSVGDKFHFQLNPPGIPPAIDRISITGKYFSEPGDTVFYIRFHDSYWTELESEPEPHLVYHFWTGNDTISYTYLDSLISYYDGSFQCNPELAECDTNIYYSEQHCGMLINGYFIATNDFEPDVYKKEYGQGLGWVWSYYYSGSSLPPGVIYDMEMFYYQKNGVDCGTPDTMTVSTPEITDNQRAFSIYPNPARDYFNVLITFPDKSVKYKMFSIYGDLTGSGEWTQEVNRYNCMNLSPGIYIIRAQINNKSINYKLIIE
jgi:hypothetical protein